MSGGQQQRVAVARAVAGDPAILLADEPTGNLDSKNGEAVMELLRELTANGSTICMVTHDSRYAQHADREVALFDGRVVDPPFLELEVCRQPVSVQPSAERERGLGPPAMSMSELELGLQLEL